MYSSSKQLISFHVNNILKEKELEEATIKKNLTVQIENGREVKRELLHYNLDMIISIGYRVNSIRGIAFRRWSSKVLKQYLKKGYAIDESRVILYKENLIELNSAVLKLENEIEYHEKEIVNLKGKIEENYNFIFFKGQFYDAYSLLVKLVKKATNKLILIDNYIDSKTLDILANVKHGVIIEIITKSNALSQITINKFNQQYNNFHDRFLVIDDTYLYSIGASIKDAGAKCFAINEMNHNTLKELIKVI